MKNIYPIIKRYLFNGLYSYAIFGLYALTVSPFISRYVDYGQTNIFVALFGFFMLIAEFFALNFKLKMVRIRAEERKIAYKKETGKELEQNPGKYLLFAFFMRLALRLTVIMVCMSALGFTCNEQQMEPIAVAVVTIGFFLDMAGMLYINFNSRFYTEDPGSREELKEEIKETQDWNKKYLPFANSNMYDRLEFLSDITLQIYALMLFTSLWQFINQKGIEILDGAALNPKYVSAFSAATDVFPMLFFIIILALVPMRIAYWVEDSYMAITKRERRGMWIMFFLVAIFSCAPTIIKFISVFILHFPNIPGQVPFRHLGFLLSIAFFFLALFLQIIIFGRENKKQTPENNT